MNPGEPSSEIDGAKREGGSSRREFLGRTIGSGALIAATSVFGGEVRSIENQDAPQPSPTPGNASSEAGATTAELLVEKLVEWGVSVVFGLPGDNIAHILDALRQRQDKIRLLSVVDTARRAALARRSVAHLSFPSDVQAKSLSDDDESLGRDVQHGTASSWVPQIEVPASGGCLPCDAEKGVSADFSVPVICTTLPVRNSDGSAWRIGTSGFSPFIADPWWARLLGS